VSWYAVVDRATGALFSGTEDPARLADPMPAQFEVVQLAEAPIDGQGWNSAMRTFVLFKADVEVFIEELQREVGVVPLPSATTAAARRAWIVFEGRIASGNR
jgi:hypothetical protein